MAYQIMYTDTELIKEVKSDRRIRYKWAIYLLVIVLLGSILQMKQVQNCLIPGDPEVTRAAFSGFAQELREGERFKDAAAAFCRQIIESDTLE